MAKKKVNKKKKKAADIKRIVLLVFGSAAVVSLLFIAGYLVDYLSLKFTKTSSPGRFSILENDENIGEHNESLTGNDNAVLKENKYSFFDTLIKKDEKKAEHDIKREEALRSHKGPVPVIKPEEKVQESAQSSTLFAMQLGSFKTYAAAKTFSDKYISKGYKPYIVSAVLPGKGTVYRVRIGRFRDIEDAQEFSSEFEKKEKVSAFITSK
jgi:cell division septation protein DedD